MADDSMRDRRREFKPIDRPPPPALDDANENNHEIPRLIDDSAMHQDENSPSHVLSQTPEFVKLIATSLFVAVVIQRLIFRGRNPTGSHSRGNSSWRGNSENNIVGTASVSSQPDSNEKAARNRNYDRLRTCKSDNETKDDSLVTDNSLAKPLKSTVGSMRKSKKNNVGVAKRNYDKLVSPKKTDASTCEISNVASNHPRDQSSNNNPQYRLEAPNTPPIQLHSKACHPGLTAYYNWLSTTTSLYRIYSIPSYANVSVRSDSSLSQNEPSATVSVDSESTFYPAILPMQPSSERGQVPVYLEVTNRTSYESVHVYWVDYKGNEIYKGSIRNGGGIWTQTTYIGHPWTFRKGRDDRQPTGEESVLLKYVPFRIIPTVPGAETAQHGSFNGPIVGIQRFTLKDVPDGFVLREGLSPVCYVEDSIMPEPPLTRTSEVDTSSNNNNNPWASVKPFSPTEMTDAIRWSCLQMQREDAANPGRGLTSAKRLLQYLRNICLHPDEPKYRKLRTGNRICMETIYNTGARGVLLALGFEEHLGYLEMGPGEGKTLSYERIKDVSDAMEAVSKSVNLIENGDDTNVHDRHVIQPEGADGFGRAGFGHADGMNI
mmetsp:Transcript_8175/g.16776  ORF Transcript_8175/g.16776 Transcript_8175/m.16776 type:complete len:603 (-) Transcript_8175:60-1868(-)